MALCVPSTLRQVEANLQKLLAIPNKHPAAGDFLFAGLRGSPIHRSYPLHASVLRNSAAQVCVHMLRALAYEPDPLYPVPTSLQRAIPASVAVPSRDPSAALHMSEYVLFAPVAEVARDVVVGYFASNDQRTNYRDFRVDPFTACHTGRFALDLAANAIVMVVSDGEKSVGLRTYVKHSRASRDFATAVVPYGEYDRSTLPEKVLWSISGTGYATTGEMAASNAPPGARHGLIDSLLSSLPNSSARDNLSENASSTRKRPRVGMAESPPDSVFDRALDTIVENLCHTFHTPALRVDAPPATSSYTGRSENVTRRASEAEAEIMRRLLAEAVDVASLCSLLREPYVALPRHGVRLRSGLAGLSDPLGGIRKTRAAATEHGSLHGADMIASQNRERRRLLLRARKNRALEAGSTEGELDAMRSSTDCDGAVTFLKNKNR